MVSNYFEYENFETFLPKISIYKLAASSFLSWKLVLHGYYFTATSLKLFLSNETTFLPVCMLLKNKKANLHKFPFRQTLGECKTRKTYNKLLLNLSLLLSLSLSLSFTLSINCILQTVFRWIELMYNWCKTRKNRVKKMKHGFTIVIFENDLITLHFSDFLDMRWISVESWWMWPFISV